VLEIGPVVAEGLEADLAEPVGNIVRGIAVAG
jgi:hypothetical protein